MTQVNFCNMSLVI